MTSPGIVTMIATLSALPDAATLERQTARFAPVDRAAAVPVDIAPRFVTAEELVASEDRP